MSVYNEHICTPFLVRHCGGLLQVVLVRWNEPFQKLATCDMEGGIFVWIQYEGRWSVELVNDRGAQVTDSVPATKAVKVLLISNGSRCRSFLPGERLHLVT